MTDSIAEAIPWGQLRFPAEAPTEGVGAFSPSEAGELHGLWCQDVERLGPFVKSGSWWRQPQVEQDIVVLGRVDSSQDAARALLEAGLARQWTSVLAAEQAAGRGQMRRPWTSPAGNLYVSIVLGEVPPELDRVAPIAAGAAVAESLREVGWEVRLKWPNDLVLEERKVGGILLEERQGATMLGLGINLAAVPPGESMRPGAALAPGLLPYEHGPLSLWLHVAPAVVRELAAMFAEADASACARRAQRLLLWRGREVRVVQEGGAETSGRLLGLAEDGALVLEKNGEKQGLYSGGLLTV